MNFLCLSIVLLGVLLCLVSQGQTSVDNLIVTLPVGKVSGNLARTRGVDVYQFLGIPFAEPPLNELRFAKPVAKKPWNGIISRTSWPPHCIQAAFPGFNSGYELSEDCLTLNVFTPVNPLSSSAGDKPLRPVMVWIHGGGFSYGSAHSSPYNGTILAAFADVLIISINYRLGPLGFLHLPQHGVPTNLGLYDQVEALKWVKDNAKYFGGDPDRVTIFGESAGGMSVSALVLSPLARGLFKNAIVQSGSIYNIDLWFSSGSSDLVLEKANCMQAANVFNCLQSADVNVFSSVDGFLFWPVYGDDFLPDTPEQLTKSIDPSVNLLLGIVGNEGCGMLHTLDPVRFNATNPTKLTLAETKSIFGKIYGTEMIDYVAELFLDKVDKNNPNDLRLAIGQSLGDITLSCPTFMFGYNAVKYQKTNVHAYHQTFKPSKPTFITYPPSDWIPATHGDDVGLLFGSPLNQTDHSNEDVIMSLILINSWGHFARTGEAPKIATQNWAKWEPDSSGEIDLFVMELNPMNLGRNSNQVAVKCQRNWPSPIKKINLNFGVDGKSDSHEEL